MSHSILLLAKALVFGLLLQATAMAEVFRTLPASKVHSVLSRIQGEQVGQTKMVFVNGRSTIIQRWLAPLSYEQTAKFIEQNINSIFERDRVASSKGAETMEMLQAELDGSIVFSQVLQVTAGEKKKPSYTGVLRSLLLRPAGRGTEIVINEVTARDDLQKRAQLAEARSAQWSVNGAKPIWTVSQERTTSSKNVIVFEMSTSFEEGQKLRAVFLAKNGFQILDKTTSNLGIMITAKRGKEKVNIFSYLEDGGKYIEVINYAL